jgi:nicotinamide mononucleotide (NMN) deamidase PncC
MEHVALPYLRDKLGLAQIIKAHTLKTCGIGESSLDSRIADLETSANPTIGLSAHPGQSDIRITAKADSEQQADALIADMEARIRERVGEVIFGADEDTLESVVVGMLRERGLSIAVAEANTGGLVSGWLDNADVEGDTFHGGWVLPRAHRWTMGQDSTFSRSTSQEALRLATEVCTVTGSDVGLAVINSGPDDTHITAVYEDRVYAQTTRFRGYDLHSLRWIASMALDLVRKMCLGVLEPV